MQQYTWNDLRYLLAIKRGKSLAEASRLMGVNATTVSRRLKVLHRASGESLWYRSDDGSLSLTDRGRAIVERIENMETEADQAALLLDGGAVAVRGTVRVTAVPVIINRLLVPRSAKILNENPELRIELIPDSRNFNLVTREADIAVRLGRPQSGGSDTIARRIGMLDYCVYMHAKHENSTESGKLPWIGYVDEFAGLPTARWIDNRAQVPDQELASIRVQDTESAISAVEAGYGKSLLPCGIADRLPKLARDEQFGTPVSREIWLLAHRGQIKAQRITEVMRWIQNVLTDV